MDLNARKLNMVRPKDGNRGEEASVDVNLLDMWRKLLQDGEALNLSEQLATGLKKIGYDLTLGRHLSREEDKKGLDHLAQSLSQNALKIGATRILSLAIELQSLSRIGDFGGVNGVLEKLDHELVAVESALQ